jgi:hypothetical protein
LNYWFKEKVSYIYTFNYHCGQTIFFVTIEYNNTLWSKQQQCNILLMQETHFSQNIENNLIQDFKGSLYQSNGISNSRGVAIWIKKNIQVNCVLVLFFCLHISISLYDFIIDFKLWTGLSNFIDWKFTDHNTRRLFGYLEPGRTLRTGSDK